MIRLPFENAEGNAVRTRISFGGTISVLLAAMVGFGVASPTGVRAKGGDGVFFARPHGRAGELIAYGMDDGEQRFALPAGRLSADEGRYVSIKRSGDETVLSTYDQIAGFLAHRWQMDGAWELAGLSLSGRWVAVARLPSEAEREAWTAEGRWETDLRIVDNDRREVTHDLRLDGRFEVDALSIASNGLFLIEHRPAVKPDHYVIRFYDLAAEALQDGELRDKRADEVMTGFAWGGAASADGRWLLTLYLDTRRTSAFVHALDLPHRLPVCIDLPSGDGDMSLLKHYALTLAPDGETLYATNPALGVVAEIDLETRKVVDVATFPARSPAANDQTPVPPVVAAGGQTIAFASGSDVWVYDVQARDVAGPYTVGDAVVGLGTEIPLHGSVGEEARRLYVALADRTSLVLDTASGDRMAFATDAL